MLKTHPPPCVPGTLFVWLALLRHTFHIHEWSVWWPPWSGPPLNHKPICMLHLSLNVPTFHRPIELQIAHSYAPSPGPPELLQFWQPCLPIHCFNVLQWHGFWACEHLHGIPLEWCFLPRQQYLATMQQPSQLVFHCCSHPYRALATIHESV